jgi:hypothetical protein
MDSSNGVIVHYRQRWTHHFITINAIHISMLVYDTLRSVERRRSTKEEMDRRTFIKTGKNLE